MLTFSSGKGEYTDTWDLNQRCRLLSGRYTGRKKEINYIRNIKRVGVLVDRAELCLISLEEDIVVLAPPHLPLFILPLMSVTPHQGTTLKLNQLHTHTHSHTATQQLSLCVSSPGFTPVSPCRSFCVGLVLVSVIVILWPCWPWHSI